jgi:hypothetical protein
VTDNVFSLVAGIGIGAAAMFFTDPQMGERRRTLARDKVTRARKSMRNGAAIPPLAKFKSLGVNTRSDG